ncbi:hypothetical protein GCM10027275_54890 [Rhabdobacter roseus]|uniref:Uncharacterized protein n=1 Tax=Rhabdobacter roseus TaxID=1655419 RepID=A0A840TW80_9BACT|nr:hypothetical protein [Rhabdobacter roseus]MBB5287504.1 hypothetical protein [Rhabdobacter roseus]
MNVLLLATVREFFRQRAGFFLVMLFLLFGFMSSREHYAFALFFLTDPHGMKYLALIWLAYGVLCGHFVRQHWAQPSYTFIYRARLLPPGRRVLRLSVVALGLLQPILFYGFYVFMIARQDQLLAEAWPIPGLWLGVGTLLVCVMEQRLRHPEVLHPSTSRPRIFASASTFRRPARWTYWTLEWLLRERGLTLLLGKAGTFLFVTGTLVYYSTGTYDLRLPAVGFTLAYLLNAGLSYELYQWESQAWLWGRSLPTSLGKRFGRMVLLHALLLLPETALLMRYTWGTLGGLDWLQLYGLGLSALLGYHVFLYRSQQLLEDTVRVLMGGFVVLTLLVLYHTPLWALAAALLALAYAGWRRWYW